MRINININIRFLCKQWDWNGQNVDCNGCTKVLEPPHTIAKPASLWFSWMHKSDKGLRADYPVLHNMKLCSFLRKSDTFLVSSLIGVFNLIHTSKYAQNVLTSKYMHQMFWPQKMNQMFWPQNLHKMFWPQNMHQMFWPQKMHQKF